MPRGIVCIRNSSAARRGEAEPKRLLPAMPAAGFGGYQHEEGTLTLCKLLLALLYP